MTPRMGTGRATKPMPAGQTIGVVGGGEAALRWKAGLAGSAPAGSPRFWGMLLMALAFGTYALAVVLARARCLMIERDRGLGVKR